MATGTATYTGGSKSSSPWREIRIVVTETGTSVANNTSTLSYSVYLDNGNTEFSTVRIGCKVIIDGTTVLDRSYASSSQYSCGRNASVKIAEGTTTVAHGSDGKKSIASGKISATCSSAGIVATQTATSGSAFVLTDIAQASTISISTNSTMMGTERTITISRASSSFKHTLTYSFGSASGTIATKTSSTSVAFTPPKSLASQLSNAKSGTGTITCTTYNGDTSIGTSSISFTATIPATTATLSGGTWIGDKITLTLSRAANNLTHKIEYKFATQTSSTSLTTNAGSSYEWTPTSSQKSAMVQAVATDNVSGSGTFTITTYNGTATVGTSTKTWTGKIPASSFTRSSASLTMGGSQTFTITRAGTNLTHKLTYAFGSLTNQSIGTGIGTSKTWTVPTSLASQLSNASSGTVTVTLTTYNGTAVCGSASTVTFTASAPVSTMTFSATSVNAGTGTLTITLNRATTNMTHLVQYKFSTDADSAYADIASSAGESATWNSSTGLAYALGSKIPSATSGTWTIKATTKIGAATVGSSTKNITVKIPSNSSTNPSLSSVSYSPYPNNASISGNSNFNGMYIVGYSKVRGTFTPTAKAGSSVSSVVLTVAGAQAASGTSSPLTASKVLSASGTVKAKLRITDSRGFTAETSETSLTAYTYSSPTVSPKSGATKVVCGRSNSSGTMSSSGTRLHVEAIASVSSLNSKNTGTLTYTVYNSSGTQTASGTVTSNSFTTGSDVFPDVEATYRVVLTASDTFGNSTTYSVSIPSDTVTMDFRAGGKGIGIGMFSQGANRFDVAWDSYFNKNVSSDRLVSLLRGTSGGFTHIRIVPRWSFNDLLGGTESPYPAYDFLEAWVKKVVETYPSDSSTTYIGNAYPSGFGFIICEIATMGDKTNGLPNTAAGIYVAYQGEASLNRGSIVRFGVANYTFYTNLINGNETATLEYTTNSIVTSAQFANIVVRKSGKVVTMRVDVTPSTTSTGSTWTEIGVIPSGFRPLETYYASIPSYSSTYYYNGIRVTTAGAIQVYKNTTNSNVMRTTLTWII